MRFDEALGLLFTDKAEYIFNTKWNEKNRNVRIVYPEHSYHNTLPYLLMISMSGAGPWVPSNLDMFSDTWEVR